MRIERESDLGKDFDNIPISQYWSVSNKDFSKRHNIHIYPAKFPPLLVDKALGFAGKQNIAVEKVADIFCGCGTTALESLLANKDFWGIDCNPVATLITRVKTAHYNQGILDKYYISIMKSFRQRTLKRPPQRILNNNRLAFWYREKELADINALIVRIMRIVPKGKYRDFFLCCLSNILKKTSLWLQKSIKPTKDYKKKPHDVEDSFLLQYRQMLRAVKGEDISTDVHSAIIKTGNIMTYQGKFPQADLLVTSPPYVTSYEYADLHQLSSIWLQYAKDFRELRDGSIGSTYGLAKGINANINSTGKNIVDNLKLARSKQSKAVAKYFYDMKKVVHRIGDILRPGGLGIIVIGNTEYSGIKIDNAKYLAHELFINKMNNIKIYKREIGTKILTRYRDGCGRFTNKASKKNIYHCEFLITFRTPQTK